MGTFSHLPGQHEDVHDQQGHPIAGVEELGGHAGHVDTQDHHAEEVLGLEYSGADKQDFTDVDDDDISAQPIEEINHIFSRNEEIIHYDEEDGGPEDRKIFELEYDHDQNTGHFLQQDLDDDFSFNSNEIYITEESDDQLSRHGRGFYDSSSHFLDDFDQSQAQHFGFEQHEGLNNGNDDANEGFGQDDLFYKQKHVDRSSDLEFDKFYEPEKPTDYRGSYRINQRENNGDRRFSQGFGDIFGGRRKQVPPLIVPGF